MKIINNKVLNGTSGLDFSFDLYLPDAIFFEPPHPLLIFAHGFKGFKDWGHWHRIAENFAANGFAFLKFNFSHNGTRPENLTEFCDLEAFGNNNFSKELSDLNSVINWSNENAAEYQLDKDNISLIGHSRGGPIVLLQGAMDERISKIICWAAVHELDYAWQDELQLEKWKNEGVFYSKNARTGQDLPLYYQLYEDFTANCDRLSVQKAVSKLNKAVLIVHGTNDPAVSLASAEYLHHHAANSILKIIARADHVFGGRHPFSEIEALPEHTTVLIEETINFLHNS
jgi:acetyl esterase/lipase